MVGVVMVLRPGGAGFKIQGLFALASGMLVGLQLAINSHLVQREGKNRISLAVQFYGMLLASIAALFVGVGSPDWQRSLFSNPQWATPWLDYPTVVLAFCAMGVPKRLHAHAHRQRLYLWQRGAVDPL